MLGYESNKKILKVCLDAVNYYHHWFGQASGLELLAGEYPHGIKLESGKKNAKVVVPLCAILIHQPAMGWFFGGFST